MSTTPVRRRHAVCARLFVVALVVSTLSGCGSAGAFCDATQVGASPHAVIASYLHACGSDYSIWKGPLDADKSTTVYAKYAQVVEYSLNVKNNSEGQVAFVLVGQRTAGAPWRTLGSPGTGP